jgi:hypothetical protein
LKLKAALCWRGERENLRLEALKRRVLCLWKRISSLLPTTMFPVAPPACQNEILTGFDIQLQASPYRDAAQESHSLPERHIMIF